MTTADSLRWPASRSYRIKCVSEGWWRRRESNPRPRIFTRSIYVHIRIQLFSLPLVRSRQGANGRYPLCSRWTARGPVAQPACFCVALLRPNRRGRRGRGRLCSQSQLIVGSCVVSTLFTRGGPRHAASGSITPVEPSAPPKEDYC